ncbi:MAG: sugar transferase [Verrucomicrobiales bacterium]|nr:sugar transferase [Verrucomicrobiales bacterium]
MLGRKQEINLKLNQITDGLVLVVAFWISHKLRYDNYGGIWPENVKIPVFKDFIWLMAIVVPFTPLVLEMTGYYHHPLQKTTFLSLRQYAKTLVIIGVLIGGFIVFNRVGDLSRGFLILLTLLGGGMLLVKEYLLKRFIRRQVKLGKWQEEVVLVGDVEEMNRFEDELISDLSFGVKVVKKIDLENSDSDELIKSLHEYSVKRVFFAAKHVSFGKVQTAVNECEVEGVEVWLFTDFIETTIARPSLDAFGGSLMMVFRSAPEATWAMLVKGLIDRVLAVALIIATFPLWVFAMIGIKISSPGTILFKQERGGKNGKPFRMYKFRTMVAEAEEKKAELINMNEMSGPVFKIQNDPRVFPFGDFLRKWSIDELPQLLNVLLGQMSIVGPRPLPVDEVEKIQESSHRRRLSMKPGITCVWQISGRSEITSFEEWVKLDLEYIDGWSLGLDLKILLKTLPAVFLKRGAR